MSRRWLPTLHLAQYVTRARWTKCKANGTLKPRAARPLTSGRCHFRCHSGPGLVSVGEPSSPVSGCSLGWPGRGAWRSLVSALVWGTRGPEFESRRPDQERPRKRGFSCSLDSLRGDRTSRENLGRDQSAAGLSRWRLADLRRSSPSTTTHRADCLGASHRRRNPHPHVLRGNGFKPWVRCARDAVKAHVVLGRCGVQKRSGTDERRPQRGRPNVLCKGRDGSGEQKADMSQGRGALRVSGVRRRLSCGCRRPTSPCASSMNAMTRLPSTRKRINGIQTSAVASVTYTTTSVAWPPSPRPEVTIVVAARPVEDQFGPRAADPEQESGNVLVRRRNRLSRSSNACVRAFELSGAVGLAIPVFGGLR